MLVKFLVSLFGALIIGLPVSFSLLFSAVFLMWEQGLFTCQLLGQQFVFGLNNFSLLAVPFFMIAGELMNRGGITKRLVDVVYIFVGRFRGGLGYVCVLASVIFAGLSGSAIADSAALGGVLIPMMIARGYDRRRSTGIVISSAIIANVIPPSLGFILYGVVSGASVTRMFMGGLVPGVLIGLGLMLVWNFTARADGLQPDPCTIPMQERKEIVIGSIPALILPALILVGLRGGIFTPTEAGCMAFAYAFVLGKFVYKTVAWKDMISIIYDGIYSTAKVLFIIGASLTISWIITASNMAKEIVNAFAVLTVHPVLLVLLCQLLFLVFGMVLDMTPIITILVPLMLPLIKAAGVNIEYFGILSVITMTFGLLTPPVGTVLYVGCGISKISIIDAVKGAWPFMLLEALLIVLMSVAPQIITVPMGWLA